MAEYQRDIRVSDTEREDALTKLGAHMTEGRLTIDEYGDRTAKVATAKTRGDVLALFEDLPEPRPAFGRPASPAARAGPPGPARRMMPTVVPVVGIIVAIGLLVALKIPFFALLPFIFIFAHSGRWGRHGRSGSGK